MEKGSSEEGGLGVRGGSSGGRRVRGFVVGLEEGKSWAPGKGWLRSLVWRLVRRRPGEVAPDARRAVSCDCGIPRADARFVANEEVDFWSRGGMEALGFAKASDGWGGGIASLLSPRRLFAEGLVAASSVTPLSEVKLPPSTTVSNPPKAVISFSTGRSASRFRRAAQRSCSFDSSASVRRASGSLVSFAAEVKDVAARAWDDAAARRVAGGCGGGVDWRILDACRACWWAWGGSLER